MKHFHLRVLVRRAVAEDMASSSGNSKVGHSLKHQEIGFVGVFAHRRKQEKLVGYFQRGAVRSKAPASSESQHQVLVIKIYKLEWWY